MAISRQDPMVQAAIMYYLRDQTMSVIANQLGTSRSTVSRLLKRAKETGLVEITLHLESTDQSGVAAKLKTMFAVDTVVVPNAPVRGGSGEAATLEAVAKAAARLLPSWIEPHMTVGVAWGTTTAALARQVEPRPLPGTRFVQLNGAGNIATTGLDYAGEILSRLASAHGGAVVEFPVPAFFDYAATKAAMWRERTVQRVLKVQSQAALALFSVGALGGDLPSRVYSGAYLSAADVAELERQHVAGDVATVFLRADGSHMGISLNERASGPSPGHLRSITHRVCMVASARKATALLAALRAGLVTDLVVDRATANELAALLT